ncbi:hypothetical protein CyaNS01_00555 [Cyanobium sp. NS01]|nr:hypothetical protein CyaNS01_00555 [Cyanobium sp. NS01]
MANLSPERWNGLPSTLATALEGHDMVDHLKSLSDARPGSHAVIELWNSKTIRCRESVDLEFRADSLHLAINH